MITRGGTYMGQKSKLLHCIAFNYFNLKTEKPSQAEYADPVSEMCPNKALSPKQHSLLQERKSSHTSKVALATSKAFCKYSY